MQKPMTEAMAQRMDVARLVACPFEPLTEVLGACACGSVSLGLADEESDVDIACIVSSVAPKREERMRIYAQLSDPDEEFDVDALGPNTFDCLQVRGLQVELMFYLREELEQRLAGAMEGASVDRQGSFALFSRFPYTILSDIHYGRILFERDGVVSGLKNQITYPESLRRRILQQGRFWRDPHLLYEHERACRRGDLVYALQCQSKIVDHFVQAVFALNRTYCPGDKWTLHFLDQFKYVPDGFQERFREFVAGENEVPGLVRKNELAHKLFNDLREMVKAELTGES